MIAQQQIAKNWQEVAIKYLRTKTKALPAMIVRFVQLFWEPTASYEENLYLFYEYQNEVKKVQDQIEYFPDDIP